MRALSAAQALVADFEGFCDSNLHRHTLRSGLTSHGTSVVPSTTKTVAITPVIPAGTPAVDYNSAGLSALWSQVELSIPVAIATQTQVVSANRNFTVPNTPKLPSSLQDHANTQYKAPEGFLYGVSIADQQVGLYHSR